MTLNLKELIVLKEKLKNTYAYQNSKKLKAKEQGKFIIESTENDLVYELVEFFEKYIEDKSKANSKLNDKVTIVIEDGIPLLESIEIVEINKIDDLDTPEI
jgi:hypothetical protein